MPQVASTSTWLSLVNTAVSRAPSRPNPSAPEQLLVGEQVGAGAQHAADAVERVTDAAAVSAGVLLNALAAAVYRVAGQRDDVEGVHDSYRVG